MSQRDYFQNYVFYQTLHNMEPLMQPWDKNIHLAVWLMTCRETHIIHIFAQMWKRWMIISQCAANKCCFNLAVYSPACARYPFAPPSCGRGQLTAQGLLRSFGTVEVAWKIFYYEPRCLINLKNVHRRFVCKHYPEPCKLQPGNLRLSQFFFSVFQSNKSE